MTYKDVLAPVISLEEDEAALVAAGELARRFDAKASALVVAVHPASAFAAQAQPLSVVLQDIAQGAQSHAAQERAKIVAWLEQSQRAFEVRDLTIEGAVEEDRVVAHARVADLVVMARSATHSYARQSLIEDVLFKSGRPMLLVPCHPVRERDWKTIVVAWNAKAEAVRAVSGAMPLLKAAERVVLATVDAKPSASGHSTSPGAEFAAHLARHGVRVEVHNVDSIGRAEDKALLDEAAALNADMIVLGAYGHSRAREMMFGGVTRALLAASPVPLFMSH